MLPKVALVFSCTQSSNPELILSAELYLLYSGHKKYILKPAELILIEENHLPHFSLLCVLQESGSFLI